MTATTSSPRPRCATPGASSPRRATTPCSSPTCARSPSPRARAATCRGSPARRARARSPGSSRRSRRACASGSRTAYRSTPRSRPTTRSRSSSPRATPAYFLVVADFINWAKENGIRVGPGRGSGAGSMCAYAMKITDLDPIPHGLIFERFLNPERVSMPDFDIDFDERRRGEVIRYVTEKYGSERVAQIVTYGTIKAKQAVKDSARVMGHPFNVGEQLTKAMPADVMGKGVPLSGIYDPEHPRYAEGSEFRALVETEPHFKEIVETAKGLEGLKRQWGVHAAGVIMSQRAAHRRHPDHEAAAGRPGPHPVRLPDVRDARPGQDGLPRPAQPHDPRRRHREREGQPRRGPRPRRPVQGHDRQGDLRPALPRRHARCLPARRWRHAHAAQADAARQLRGHLRRPRALPTRARWVSTRTRTSRCARTASRSSRRSTRSSRASSSRR